MAKIMQQTIPFTQVANVIFNDKNLSAKAKGIFGYIQSKPPGWKFSAQRISWEMLDGVRSILGGLKELERQGYLVRIKDSTGRVEYMIGYDKTVLQKAKMLKQHSAKTASISNKDCINNKESLCEVAIAPQREPLKLTKKSMKPFKEPIIELDEFGEEKEPVTPKKKTPIGLIARVAMFYADTFNVPKENLYMKYKRPIEEMVNCSKEYYGEDFVKIEAEIKFRIEVAKKFIDFKNWRTIKLAKIAENWNEIPAWKEEIEL